MAVDPVTAERFTRLWEAFPEGGRIDADREAAERHFAGLSDEDQQLAIRAVPGYVAHLKRQDTRPKALHSWLRQRRFTNLVAIAKPGESAPVPGNRVFVREGTPAWEAWERHERKQGRVPKLPMWSELARADGYWFPSELPFADASRAA